MSFAEKKTKLSNTNDLSDNIIIVAFVWEVNTYSHNMNITGTAHIYMIIKYTSNRLLWRLNPYRKVYRTM